MYTIEFEADIKNGMIKIPSKYNLINTKNIKIVVQIEDSKTNNQLEKKSQYSDEYIKEHWRELIMTGVSDGDYYKSDQYKEDRGTYLMEKYK